MRINPVYKSVNRPLTLLGVERRLFFFAAIIGVATFNLMGSFLGGLLVFLALYLFAQWSTKNDPQMLRILLELSPLQASLLPGQIQTCEG